MTGRRGLLTALAGCAVAAALVLLASGRVWGRAALTTVTGSVDRVSVTGHSAEPALPALAVALLVLGGGVIASRGWVRRVVGVVVVVVGGAVVSMAIASRSDVAQALTRRAFAVAHTSVKPHTSGWAVLCVCAGVIAVASGAVIVAVGAKWPALGARYDADGARSVDAKPRDGAMSEWDALDRGEDPTV